MDVTGFVRLFELLRSDRSSFFYSGAFPDAHTANLISIGESLTHGEGGKRLTYVMVEAYQNIIRHRAHDIEAGRPGARSLFALRHASDVRQVAAMNPVCHKETGSLQRLLSGLDGLDRSQLKELFLERLQAKEVRDRGGAGLGLIEMARRSGHSLQHRIEPISDLADLFTLSILFGDSLDGGDALERIRELHRLVEHLGIVAGHTGEWNAGAQQALWRMLGDAAERDGERMARAYLSAVELVQRFPSPRAAVLFTSLDARTCVVVLFNAAPRELVAELVALVSADRSELARRYKGALRDPGAGWRTPLLDLAMHAPAVILPETRESGDGSLLILRVPL